MEVELKMPSVGESVLEGVVAEWLVAEGEAVEGGKPVVVVDTDKVAAEVPAPASGVLKKVLKKKGETVRVGEVLGIIDTAHTVETKTTEQAARTSTGSGSGGESQGAGSGGAASEEEETPFVMPAARRVMEEAGIQPSEVQGTGPRGRVLKGDVLRAVHTETTSVEAPKPPATGTSPASGGHPAASAGSGGSQTSAAQATREPAGKPATARARREDRVVPMSMLRRRISEKLVRARQEAALLTTFNDVDMSAILAVRRKRKQEFQDRYGAPLGIVSFFVKAVVDALKLYPTVNASVEGTNILYHDFYDIGVAIGSERGLVVPIIRDADRLSLAEIELKIREFAHKADEGRLDLADLQGGTFTISNGGVYGSLLSTPIVNPPQSAVLGLHRIEERPVVRDGQVVVRLMMYLALTYDHRLIDGRQAVGFLRRVKEVIEDPGLLVLGL